MNEAAKPYDQRQQEATAAAVKAARSMVLASSPLRNTPIGRLGESQWGWIVTAGLFAWIQARIEQAITEGRDGERSFARPGSIPILLTLLSFARSCPSSPTQRASIGQRRSRAGHKRRWSISCCSPGACSRPPRPCGITGRARSHSRGSSEAGEGRAAQRRARRRHRFLKEEFPVRVLTCQTCGERKVETLFYRQPNTRHGRHLSCCECVKARARAYREANLDHVQEYDRERGQLEHRKEAVRLRAPRYKWQVRNKDRKWRSRNPEKYRAHAVVGYALRAGKLVRSDHCERCGSRYRIEAHHEDYFQPFEITWLCKPCHGERHREINEERRKAS